jgi:hypothetical protein
MGYRPLAPFDRVLWNPPPAEFNPLTADNDTLDLYHFPLRPDPDLTPVSYGNWFEMMSPPNVFIQQKVEDVFRLQNTFRLNSLTRISSQLEFSRNWSGSLIRPNAGSFTMVEGSWRVSNPVPPPGPLTDGEYRTSVWVGLDGHDPASPTMPQIGTLQEVDVVGGAANTPILSAWWQWWLRDEPGQHPIVINFFPIEINDRIYAKVTALGPTSARFFLKNKTRGTTAGFDMIHSDAFPSLVEGLTAEWIFERPTKIGSDELDVMTNYQSMTMRHCNATVGTGSLARDQNLIGASLIRMAAWDDIAHPGSIISTPTLLGNDRMLMRYGDFGP